MPDLEGLTIQELDLLTDGLTAWEHFQHQIPHFIAITNQEGPKEQMQQAAQEAENERRGQMEATTLLKAKLIERKTVLQANQVTAEVLGGNADE